MGCLKNILRAIILTLAVIGFMSLGGKELIVGLIHNYINPSHDTLLERAQKVGDFSEINDEFELEKAAGIMAIMLLLPNIRHQVKKCLLLNQVIRQY